MIKLDNRLFAAVSVATLMTGAMALPATAQDAASTDSAAQTEAEASATTTDASAGTGASQAGQSGAATSDSVVAEVNGTQITLSDVRNAISTLPPQMQQFPEEMVVSLALDQLVTRELILNQAQASGLESDPEVQSLVQTMMEEITEQALVQVWVARQLNEQITDEQLQSAFASFQETNPDAVVTFEQARPQIEQALRQQLAASLGEQLRRDAEVTYFDAAGNPTEQSDGSAMQNEPAADDQNNSAASETEESADDADTEGSTESTQ
ncbi:SurA N-terminal domain-containing protein [Devosia sp. RR2S18]|uniref:SurA N-terminal domain-containing protein n=1 Tax=Devosia rhizosphaerae TaxID=3049774 RepID=UPI0025412041|nr:SurA N-terminal domain-containing protein [Devosia sp. RR2S18]WIJ24965.1 SurA N-terminal domain-containing protein [Devosia sp. RR2S18]